MGADWIRAEWPAPESIVAGSTLRNSNLSDVRLPGEPCWLNQVHGANVVVVAPYDKSPDADGSVGGHVGDVCVVRTADCLPVLFCSLDGDEIAAAHCGWRGLAAGVLENTVRRMGSSPAQLMAWLGPAISQPSFEVGDEVRAAFLARDRESSACFEENERGRWQADLYGLARLKLKALGVTKVYGGGFCTFEDKERFFSYRRDPNCGRMISFAAIETP